MSKPQKHVHKWGEAPEDWICTFPVKGGCCAVATKACLDPGCNEGGMETARCAEHALTSRPSKPFRRWTVGSFRRAHWLEFAGNEVPLKEVIDLLNAAAVVPGKGGAK